MWPTGTQLLVKPPWKLKLLVFDVSGVVAVPTVHAQLGESFSKHLWFAIVIVFLAEMGRIPCCGRPESSSSNI